MADTGFVRFTSVNDEGDIWTNESNLTSANEGDTTSNSTNTTVELVLSGLSLGIPAGSTITGIEYQYRGKRVGGLGGTFNSIKSFLQIGATTGDELTFASIPTTYTLKTDGGSSDLMGLTVTDSNVNNLELVFKIGNNALVSATFYIEGSNSNESPSIKVYYTEPEPTPSTSLEPKTAIRSSGYYVRESSL